jgi:hypothetical protein
MFPSPQLASIATSRCAQDASVKSITMFGTPAPARYRSWGDCIRTREALDRGWLRAR